jgi:5-methylcytosine-specific restriction protein A
MPTTTNRPCKNRQCTNITRDATGYCTICRPAYLAKEAKRRDGNRPNSRERGYTSNWDRFRKMYLRNNPLCVCGQPATLPHHILPIADGGEMYDEDNLMPMCRLCHEVLHGRKK